MEEWRESVDKRTGFTAAQKQKMMLSRETMEGLEITGKVLITQLLKKHYEHSFFFFSFSEIISGSL